ncbi:hypothetical protein SDRG_06168 [Saprolegnia diclina VS20]|uniref:START domain-containing protein n=1 Tax=Saprolegnia diclina (strain VS20) TaxID=1156394 RepID=T0RW60_SAPDV|nr:hypothetical protein SDRG_06168 [Saprolegnia diclina VS20]EQC36733.1 hypothetical protein SDRG_06168 [Saprolegnia diclina VS20]|eukprot:XP_008610154.1 hypothetical protein SDRG_06168 [Saprolegnia diclina VS20]
MSVDLDAAERTRLLERATTGLEDLVAWADGLPPNSHVPRSPTWASEVCRQQLVFERYHDLDDIVELYKAPSSYLGVDNARVLYETTTATAKVALKWGVFRSPIPFVRDRDACYLESSQLFLDRRGRRGFARFITSYPLRAMDYRSGYIRADVRNWGLVLLESSDTKVIYASTIVDIDWKGQMPAWGASHMTSRRAQSIKQLPALLRKRLRDRCGLCHVKPAIFELGPRLVPCTACRKPLCVRCRNADVAPVCVICRHPRAPRPATRPSRVVSDLASTVGSAGDARSPQTCRHATRGHAAADSGWFTPQDHRRPRGTGLDLSYVSAYKVSTVQE